MTRDLDITAIILVHTKLAEPQQCAVKKRFGKTVFSGDEGRNNQLNFSTQNPLCKLSAYTEGIQIKKRKKYRRLIEINYIKGLCPI